VTAAQVLGTTQVLVLREAGQLLACLLEELREEAGLAFG
jgi:hypothetical protein